MSSNYPGYGNSTTQRCQRCGMPLSPDAQGYCRNCGMQNAPVPSNTSSGQLPFSSNAAWGVDEAQSAQGNGQFGQPGPSRQFGRPGQFGGPPWGTTSPSGSLGNTAIPQQPFGNQQSYGTPSAPLQPFGGSSPSQPLSNTQQPFAGPADPQQPFGTQQSFGSPSSPLQPFGNQQPFGSQGQFAGPNNFAGVVGSPSQTNAPFAPQPQQPFYQQPVPGNGFQQGDMNAYDPDNYEDPDFSNGKKKPRVGLIIGSIVLLILLIGGGIGGYLFIKAHKPATVSTQSVTPTPTPKGPLLFHDTFQANNAGWNLAGQAGEYSLHLGGGSLTLEDDNNKLLWELLPGNKTFDNFLLNVDAVLSKGTQDNGYGVYIRGASNQTVDIATYYRFELYGDGTFAVFKGTLDASGTSQSGVLVNYTVSSAIRKQGQVNHISILANGSTMSFIVNGQILKSFTDNSYTSGSVALFVSNLANTTAGAQAKFSNLAIYPPQ
jgi:3-keto-disaccharide hydrolase